MAGKLWLPIADCQMPILFMIGRARAEVASLPIADFQFPIEVTHPVGAFDTANLAIGNRKLEIKTPRMTPDEMKSRTKRFALRCLKVADQLPQNKPSGRILANQLGRCGTSVAANYRASCKARSAAEFIAKLGVVEEEADESQFWIEVTGEHGLLSRKRLEPLHKEAGEITAIIAASRKTAVQNKRARTTRG
jgi:four helix bundle protein